MNLCTRVLAIGIGLSSTFCSADSCMTFVLHASCPDFQSGTFCNAATPSTLFTLHVGDVHIAEPGALIGFAGQRVIQDTIREQLPDGFQRAEYLHKHGMVDMVVHRHELKDTLATLLDYLAPAKAA